ncbi:MAG TPA: phage holin family protein [Acetobacteraceae bacterium]|nr:phage holin family protein [Acetobacteraceae bacterium]
MPSDRPHPPDAPRPTEASRSVPELFTSAVTQVTTLFRKEVQLARAEMSEKFGQAASAIPLLGGGAAMLLGAALLLLFALAAGIARILNIAPGWGFLIAGLIAALVGWLLIRSGLSQLTASKLVPERTAEQLSRDAEVAKEQVR